MLQYEYEERKNQANIKKHGVSFDEAVTVFQDPLLKLSTDSFPAEERFVAIGRSAGKRDLLVVHCYRQRKGEEIIRIISARNLTPAEKRRVGRLRL